MATLTGSLNRLRIKLMELMAAKTCGEILREAREKRGLTQDKLADYVGVRQESISGYERDISSPSVDVAIRIAEVLDLNEWVKFSRAFARKTA